MRTRVENGLLSLQACLPPIRHPSSSSAHGHSKRATSLTHAAGLRLVDQTIRSLLCNPTCQLSLLPLDVPNNVQFILLCMVTHPSLFYLCADQHTQLPLSAIHTLSHPRHCWLISRPRGWILLTHPCTWQATTALLLDGMNVFNRVIKVNMARGGSGPGVVRSLDPDRVQRTIHVGGLPFDEISEETLAEYFSHVGEVWSGLPDSMIKVAVSFPSRGLQDAPTSGNVQPQSTGLLQIRCQ